jgi:diguanylate cyclase (GGDEF)-like protein/PAS domain S-box-containing protein
MDITKIDAETLVKNLKTGVVVHGSDTQVLYANPYALTILRLTQEQILGKDAFDPYWSFFNSHLQKISPQDLPVNRVISSKQSVDNLEIGINDSSTAQVTWVLCNAYPEFDLQGKILHVVVTFHDITEQKKAISFESIVELANDIVIVTEASPIEDDGPKIVYVNQSFTTLTGYSKAEVYGKTPRLLQGAKTSQKTRNDIKVALNQRQPLREQIINYAKDGREYWLDMNIAPLKNSFGEITYFAAIERDITEQKQYEQQLRDLSIRDPLTTLLNRRGFIEFVSNKIEMLKRDNKPVALAMIDIDHFKRVNDSFGHDVGDKAICFISNMIKKSFRKSDVLGRLGGEEFGILLPKSDMKDATEKLNSFRAALANSPLNCYPATSNESLSLTVSAGISTLDNMGSLNTNKIIDVLLKQADDALYQAKHNGRDQVCGYFQN